ncbi:MAG TPA: hypothetical protein VME41_00295, partial [Stellaceae bacterium]|nr:hypothetical protein [Stellaceae bacterium]
MSGRRRLAPRRHRAKRATADGGRSGEVRFLGEVSSSPATVARLIGKLAGRYQKLHVCYEAGPTG